MAIEAGLTYNIGADISKFESSIGKVEEQLKYLKEALKSASGKEIEKLNADIFSLQNTLKNLKGVGVPAAQSIEKIADSSKRARIALTDVSRIAQDLPFGFIGIQNNIPQLVQSFTSLSKESKGVTGALKAIGQSLIGPAGIFLAFSIVTSGLTLLVQEYGSLGAAFDAFFGKNDTLTKKIADANKSFDEYNKSIKSNGILIAEATGQVDPQIQKANLLLKVINNLTESEKTRKVALQELQSLDKTRFENFDIEKNKLNGLDTAVKEYTQSIIANAIAKKYENKLAESSINLQTQRDLLNELSKGYIDLAKRRKDLEDASAIIDPLTGAEIAKPSISSNDIDKAFNTQKLRVDQAIIENDKLSKSFNDATLEALKFINVIEKPDKKTKVKKEPKGRAVAFDFQVLNVDKSLIQISNIKKSIDDLLKPKISAFNLEIPDIKNRLQPQIDAIQQFVLKSQEAKNQLSEFFFDPLANLFSDLATNSKTAFKNFTDAILSSIRKIVAEIIAKKIISLLASFIPGIGAAGAAIKAGSAIAGVLSSGGMLTRSANFGGVQGGGMDMSGSVNLVLRGNDLVGSINRTNMQLNRVG